MLSSLLKQHQIKQNARKEIQEKRKREAVVAATALSHVLVDHLNAGVAQAYVNQKKLDTETRILQANAAQFSKQTMLWLKLVEDFNTALKLGRCKTGIRASVTIKGLVKWRPQRPASDYLMVNAWWVTAGVNVCGQRRPICSTCTLRQVTPRRWEDSDPQQPGSIRRMSRCQEEGHLTRIAKVD
ncbi:biogenesis of lysosome-related organelles complex 1 subunit 1 [Elysia marginata]|uniref:Biogenesis of lysosome-related organelles complex 1 subunit 1 n=1 Tax=Elysia marginata TaxID=1093978 RepID=A0AAV4ECQ8_9GAST|nr:biogenesis of lysosome-related organelles complex 1 subunit 1 [Elysia marginata]